MALGLSAVAVVATVVMVVWFSGGEDGPATVTTGGQAATTTSGPAVTVSTVSTTVPSPTSTGASSTTFTIPPDTNTAGPPGVETGVVTPMAEVHTTTTVPHGFGLVGGGPGSVSGDSPASYDHCWAGLLHEESQAGASGMLDRFGSGSYSGQFYAERCSIQRWDFYGYAGETVRLSLNSSNEAPSLQMFQSGWSEEGPWTDDRPMVTAGGPGLSSARLRLPQDGWYVVAVGPFNDPATTYGLRIERSGAPFTPDIDRDGFSDQFEAQLAEFFKPLYQFDDKEEGTCLDPMQQVLLYQVSPFSGPATYNFGGPGGFVEDGWLPGERRYAAVTYVLTLERDCGAFAEESTWSPWLELPDFISHAHPGDLEVMKVIVEEGANGWVPLGVIFGRHGNSPEWSYWDELEVQAPIRGVHPVVWVSWSKHAIYPSWEECDDYYPPGMPPVEFEYCGGGAFVNYDLGSADGWNHNVGESYSWTFDYLRDSLSPYLQDVAGSHDWGDPVVDLGGEQAWGGQYFCGGIDPPWSPTGEECKDGLYTKWWPWTGEAFQFVWLMVVEGGIVEVG